MGRTFFKTGLYLAVSMFASHLQFASHHIRGVHCLVSRVTRIDSRLPENGIWNVSVVQEMDVWDVLDLLLKLMLY